MIGTLIGLAMLINAERQTPLALDPTLSERAQARAEQLCADNQWSHVGWGKSFVGLQFHDIGENLARGFNSSRAMHRALMESPKHRANILSEKYTRMGLGKSCGIVVQLFLG